MQFDKESKYVRIQTTQLNHVEANTMIKPYVYTHTNTGRTSQALPNSQPAFRNTLSEPSQPIPIKGSKIQNTHEKNELANTLTYLRSSINFSNRVLNHKTKTLREYGSRLEATSNIPAVNSLILRTHQLKKSIREIEAQLESDHSAYEYTLKGDPINESALPLAQPDSPQESDSMPLIFEIEDI